jgi:hypothetical protein
VVGKSKRTVREWCQLHDVGRRIGGQWAVSRVALAMFLDGDKLALEAYLAGDRTSPIVTAYFDRCGAPRPSARNHRLNDIREAPLSEPNVAARK